MNRLAELIQLGIRRRRGLGLACLCLEAALILSCYNPYWQTYDDVIMAMLINGYGMATAPSTNLLYCNFLWAKLIQLIPDLFDISNYTLALYLCTGIALASLWLAIAENSRLPGIKLLLVSSMLFYSFLNPQFTVTALFCSISGICSFMAYQNTPKPRFLLFALTLCFLGFIIRDWSLAFAGLIFTPFIDWKMILRSLRLLALLATFCSCLGLIYATNLWVKQDPQWQEIRAWNRERQHLTDSQWGWIYIRQPELLQQEGYSVNDMELLASHFGLAKNLMNIPQLQKLNAESDPEVWLTNKKQTLEITFDYFFTYPLVLLVIIACLLLLRRYSLRATASALIVLAIFIGIALLNRGGIWISRLYYPALYAIVAILLLQTPDKPLSKYLYISRECATLAASTMLLLTMLSYSKANLIETWEISKSDLEAAKKELNGAIWYGHPVRIEQIYKPFANINSLKKINFQCASWTTLLPNSRSYFDLDDHHGFDKYLENGFTISASQEHLKNIQVYCHEHLNGRLLITPLNHDNTFGFYRIQCVREAMNDQR